ncbi:WD repeat-containing protein 82 [Psilocybe cubensis]|uniref:WD repeat-containing protein 82 n=2 Tax=Psilocybe cubensis TaxID=181762 RepID=A0ACB8H0Y4_PSICU|nr:WD repeat-containing protein 82 [Psilocybe cubensis]KAH9481653.1 WD repeat-containing protein 82 [Psilocybe cubensis]
MPPHPSSSSASHPPVTLTLHNGLMAKLKPSKIFKTAVEPAPKPPSPVGPGQHQKAAPPARSVTGICFDDRGDQLITAGEDETFKLYSCKSGKLTKTFYSKKYGVDLPRFTHKNTAILHASTKEDDTIRYHSLHDNKYLQYFRGHKARVVSLEVSPIDDGFMSGSMDNTVRLWDLRTPNCRGLLTLPNNSVVAYDSSGMVFAVAVNEYSRILLYDTANYDKAPFITILLEDPALALKSYPPRPICMTSLSFSTNGKYLLVGCSSDTHYILDAFDGFLIAKLEGHIGLERTRINAQLDIKPSKGISGEEVSWTPDSKYVIGGSLDGRIFIWDITNLPPRPDPEPTIPSRPDTILSSRAEAERKKFPVRLNPIVALDAHPGPSRCVKFNPRLAMMASAGTELAFWLPDTSGDAEEAAKDLLKKRTA